MKADSLLHRNREKHLFNDAVERYALRAALRASRAMAAVVLLFTRNNQLSLVGTPNSVAVQALIASLVVALAVSPLQCCSFSPST